MYFIRKNYICKKKCLIKKLVPLVILFFSFNSNIYAFQCDVCSISGSSCIFEASTTEEFTTPEIKGMTYFWSVTGGLEIIGSNTGSKVSVKGLQGPTSGEISVTRYKPGEVPCAYYKKVEVIPNRCRLVYLQIEQIRAFPGDNECQTLRFTGQTAVSPFGDCDVTYNWSTNDKGSIKNGTKNSIIVQVSTSDISSEDPLRVFLDVTAKCGTVSNVIEVTECLPTCGPYPCFTANFNPRKNGFIVDIPDDYFLKSATIKKEQKNKVTINVLSLSGTVLSSIETEERSLFIPVKNYKKNSIIIQVIDSENKKYHQTF